MQVGNQIHYLRQLIKHDIVDRFGTTPPLCGYCDVMIDDRDLQLIHDITVTDTQVLFESNIVALKLFTSAQQQRSDGLGSSSTG
jgi:hypothetical protein